jgi:predicted nuclease with TOPRIM domain
MEDIQRRLDAALRRRETLQAETRRLEGKLEAAEAALKSVEEECRSKGVPPEDIDNYILKLTQKFEANVKQFELDLDIAEQQIAPFLRETQ